MNPLDPKTFAELILQCKELVAMLALLAFIWHQQTKTIPMLLIREEKKQEADRKANSESLAAILQSQREANQSILTAVDKLDASIEKMGESVGRAIEHLGELVRGEVRVQNKIRGDKP